MSEVQKVPPALLIEELAHYLEENLSDIIKPPPWAHIVKTGPGKERPPARKDWWYVRCAAILRKLYLHGPVGVGSLRVAFGCRQRRGAKGREHHKRAGGAIIRKILQQLEQAQLVEKQGTKGRVLSPKGKSLLDRLAHKIFRDLQRSMVELKKYA
ncbi:MAG: 30S ribosomal protein S19e [Candidatus Nezhaarchaeota archaeon]|nr:30S ribosomal protein S19e [Candidatus Nezhaarchaeota archaeon]MCX8142116.1 30S ribosomal protein S19e [Candidatus Nezhaarchaeota archaeon]MDW8050103.1 30S ribosomal protein S19e [Nitrososphaerota archaeon]